MSSYRRFERKSVLGLKLNQPPLAGTFFRNRFTKTIFTVVTSAIFVVTGTFVFFNFENYSLFQRVTFELAPDLLLQLKREQVWLITALLAIAFGLVTFVTFFVYRLADSISGPIDVLHKRLKGLTAGNLYQEPIRTREKDEFKELIEAYNYLQKALQIQTQQELAKLRDIKADQKDVTSQQLLLDLIDQKQLQVTGSSAPSEPTHDSRHAS